MRNLQNLRDLVSSGKTEDVLIELKNIGNEVPEIKDYVDSIGSQYSKKERKSLLGTLPNQDLTLIDNEVTSKILKVINFLEGSITSLNDEPIPKEEKSKAKIDINVAIKVSLTIALGGVIIWTIKDILITILIVLISIYLIFDFLTNDDD
jgi:hypothetical protein